MRINYTKFFMHACTHTHIHTHWKDYHSEEAKNIYIYCYRKLNMLIKRYPLCLGFPGSSVIKNLSANSGDRCLIPESDRSSGERNGNPLECSFQRNPLDRGA